MYAAGITPVFNEGVGNKGPVGDYRVRGAGAEVDKFPFPITKEVLLRGQERFDIYCAPCHGRTGYGDGMVVRRGFSIPPSYHQARLRQAPVGHFFDVITNGFGAMYEYGDRITPEDRWAIIAYVRALQLSQLGTLQDLPEAQRAALAK
jgi:mono/diheme cytochrome c family protein